VKKFLVGATLATFVAWVPVTVGFVFGIYLVEHFDFEALKFEAYFWFLMVYGAAEWLTSFFG